MKHIIWLTEWFPTKLNPYTGDGIERRAKAASLYNDIFIIHLKKDPGLLFGKVDKEERVYNENCKAIIYYYPSIAKWSRALDVLVSNFYFLTLHCKAIRQYRKEHGRPAGIQVNVVMKNGVIALFYKWFLGIKYIIVEGWSLFLPESVPSFRDKGFIFRWFTKKVIRKAAILVTLSDHLAKMIFTIIDPVPYQVVPNGVDTSIFYPNRIHSGPDTFRFIHISSLDHPKNFEQILKAVKIVSDSGYSMKLMVIGPDRKELKELTNELGIQHLVQYKNECFQGELAEAMNQSSALILYSFYETFGNVIIEANACGLPVIISDYPSCTEIVKEGETGLVVPGNNPPLLAEKMIYLMKEYAGFNKDKIATFTREHFGYDAIGIRIDQVYKDIF